MEYTPLSPFMRPITHAHLRLVDPPAPPRPVNKWELLRELSCAQTSFGITERDLTVLQGLLSFFPAKDLTPGAAMVVFPSNKTLCERLNGMPCSTMRRHLGRLVAGGLLTRRDSPNGKRYSRRQGADRVAFGFDLAPLLHRAAEIAQAADTLREAQDRIRRLREVASLMRRDLAALATFGEQTRPGLGLWDQMHDTAALTARALRRKLAAADLDRLCQALHALLDQARDTLDGPETEDLVTSDARSGQHQQNSDIDDLDLEPCCETPDPDPAQQDGPPDIRQVPGIPLHLVTRACPALSVFYPGPVRHWHQLYDAACHIRPAMGISASAWEEAQRCMGPEQAAIVLAAILERFAEIRSPGGYLRALTAKAAAGAFSSGPMVMALIGRRSAA